MVAGSGVDISVGICTIMSGGEIPLGKGVGKATSVSIVEVVKGAVRGGAVRGPVRGMDATGTSSSSSSEEHFLQVTGIHASSGFLFFDMSFQLIHCFSKEDHPLEEVCIKNL